MHKSFLNKKEDHTSLITLRSSHLKAFTMVELMAVVLVLGIILAIAVPKLFRQAENSISGSQIIADFQYIAQAIGNYASDYKKYPNSLSDLNPNNGYKYLPDVNISGNNAEIDNLTFTYKASDGDCNGNPSLSVDNLPAESYNEVKSYIGNAIKWRLYNESKSVKLCL
jgi:prepilin-type N-terminal cleavage/methylation domain-containing protein